MSGIHFVILKINDVNVSNLPHDDVVRMFLNASDPIVIEVSRKRNCNSRHELEGAKATLKPRHHHLRLSDDSQLMSGLVVCSATYEQHTPTTNRKRVNSASNVAQNKSSPPMHVLATTATQNLTLYLPPPPPLQQQSTEKYVEVTDGDNSLDKHHSNLENTVKTFESSQVNNSKIANSQYQPSPNDPNSDLQDPNSATFPIISNASPKLISTTMQTEVSEFVHSLYHVANAANTEDITEQHNMFETSVAPEIDIEEITLRKSDSNEHLGLTVCYRPTGSSSDNYNNASNDGIDGLENETCTEVYISNIQPNSRAGRDGRLRHGDQILQVNGKDVTNKKETETLIAENNNAVTLLVSRYLYTDEDDFQVPCVASLVVEDEDDDDEEYNYDDNNMAYQNCFITANDLITGSETRLNRVLLGTSTAHPEHPSLVNTVSAEGPEKQDEGSSKISVAPVMTSPTKPLAASNQKNKSFRSQLFMKYDPFQHRSIKTHLKQVNQELAMLDCRVENMGIKPAAAIRRSALDYDTEHIYETIPEDPESEPFYCTPYESIPGHTGTIVTNKITCGSADRVQLYQQKQRVAAWLGMQSTRQNIGNVSGRKNTTLHSPEEIPTWVIPTSGTNVTSSVFAKSNSIRSVATTVTTGTTGSSSSGRGNLCVNEHENLSSAYNSGSNKSGTVLTLVINSPHIHTVEHNEVEQLAALRICKSQRVIPPKDKLTSRNNHSITTVPLGKMAISSTPPAVGRINCGQSTPLCGSQQQLSTSTMYTNMANLQQTIMLQQQLFRQGLTQQQYQQQNQLNQLNLNLHQQQQMPPTTQQLQRIHMHTCPQFTSSNLSQYHFVSSQEVSTERVRETTVAIPEASKSEEPMVWKVKRRQDGSRYIVRRPARNRMLRDRALRMNVERESYDVTTTEDDTISEIKTGRYWTREERKKHIERARERRQNQQQQLATAVTMRICDKAIIHSAIKSQSHTSKKKLPNASSTHVLPNQRKQLSKKLLVQSSTKVQHHQLQISSAVSPRTEGKQKQLPLTMPPTMVAAAATTTNIASSDGVPKADIFEPGVTTVEKISINNNIVSVGAEMNVTPTVVCQSQKIATNGHKMVGLLSVTTV